MKAVIRGLFTERKKDADEEPSAEIFGDDITLKILQLIYKYNPEIKPSWWDRTPNYGVIKLFLERTSYIVNAGIIQNLYDLKQIDTYMCNCKLGKYFDIVELHANTLLELSRTINNLQSLQDYLEDFNNLVELNNIPYKLVFNKELQTVRIEKVDSKLEEENKSLVYQIISNTKYSEANEEFSNALKSYARSDHENSIKHAYKTLEKFLKITIDNHKLTADQAYPKFSKKYGPFPGVFNLRGETLKKKISSIQTIEAKCSGHTSTGEINHKEFLAETARYQINEVVNTILLLDGIMNYKR